MALRAESDDCDGFGGEYAEVGIIIGVDFCWHIGMCEEIGLQSKD